MFRCLECGNVFKDSERKKTTYEDFYGITGEFSNTHELLVSPCCESGYEEFEEDEEETDEQKY